MIAIIAILAAILFPVFAQAKVAAKKASDLSNLKQIGLAGLMYATDSDDVYNPVGSGTTCTNPTTATWNVWQALVLPCTKSGAIFLSPGAKAKDDLYGTNWYCKAQLGDMVINGDFYVSYVQNNFETWSWGASTTWSDGAANHYGFRYDTGNTVSQTAVEDVAGTIRIADGIYTEIAWEPYTDYARANNIGGATVTYLGRDWSATTAAKGGYFADRLNIEGKWRWDGQRDLRRFVETCREVGMPVVVRLGPWCHGEVRNGGFPDWLLKKKLRTRSDDPAYLAEVRILYGQIATQTKGLLWKDGGPIVGVQVETSTAARRSTS